MLEFEKKIILSPQEYDFLVRLQDQSAEKIEQINHYYDTDDFALNRKGITYRIREINDEFTATIKNHRAACGRQKAADNAQGGSLAATGRAKQG